jgi:hypothetical protein
VVAEVSGVVVSCGVTAAVVAVVALAALRRT